MLLVVVAALVVFGIGVVLMVPALASPRWTPTGMEDLTGSGPPALAL